MSLADAYFAELDTAHKERLLSAVIEDGRDVQLWPSVFSNKVKPVGVSNGSLFVEPVDVTPRERGQHVRAIPLVKIENVGVWKIERVSIEDWRPE